MEGEALLRTLAQAAGEDLMLWRGLHDDSRDVDLVAWPAAVPALAECLRAAGMECRVESDGRSVWHDPAGALREIDVLDAAAWPRWYPRLAGMRPRAGEGPAGLCTAAEEDRLLIFAADALMGRAVAPLARRSRGLLETPGVRTRLAAVGAAEDAADLAALAARPDVLEELSHDGRLSYGTAARLAWRSRPGRAALRARLSARLRSGSPLPSASGLATALRPRSVEANGPALLVTFSGMDGAGKSTAAEAAREHLEARGATVELAWARLAADGGGLDAIARPIKRVLRREGRTVADAVAAGAPSDVVDTAAPDHGRIASVWVFVVVAFAVRAHRRVLRRIRSGACVVCDRWLIDALVDLEVRYGPRPAAAAVLRRLVPQADIAVLLELDAATAAARKPGDQAAHVLRRMERLYSRAADGPDTTVLDARRPPEVIAGQVRALIDAVWLSA